MSKTLKKSKSKVRVVKRLLLKLVTIISHFFDMIWTVGASVAAAMVISTSTHRAGRIMRPAYSSKH